MFNKNDKLQVKNDGLPLSGYIGYFRFMGGLDNNMVVLSPKPFDDRLATNGLACFFQINLDRAERIG